MAKVKSYTDFIDESVKHAKDLLEKNELMQYMIDDTPGINGTKAERDKLTNIQAYELSVYSTLLEVQSSLHELEKNGSVAPIRLHSPEEEDTKDVLDIEKLLGIKLDGSKNKSSTKTKTIVIDGSRMNAEDKDNLKFMMGEILKKLEEDN